LELKAPTLRFPQESVRHESFIERQTCLLITLFPDKLNVIQNFSMQAHASIRRHNRAHAKSALDIVQTDFYIPALLIALHFITCIRIISYDAFYESPLITPLKFPSLSYQICE
jgi:hypothetical protein